MGNLNVDLEATQGLMQEYGQKKLFLVLRKNHEENEHSLEMHAPFIAKIFAGKNIKLLPMMIGQIDEKTLPLYGEALAPLFLDERTLFVISSDFCHWGEDFDYMPILKNFKAPE